MAEGSASNGRSKAAGNALPEPKRTLRTATLGVMAVTAVVSALLAWSLLPEARYALGASEPVDLGALAEADLAKHDNGYVRVRVTLSEPAAKFRRPLEQSHYRLAQAKEGNWVVYSMPDGYAEKRFLPPTLVAGRLTRASQLGARFAGVADTTGPDAWVLVDGDAPFGLTWLVGLLTMLAGFLLFNVLGLVRVLRPVR